MFLNYIQCCEMYKFSLCKVHTTVYEIFLRILFKQFIFNVAIFQAKFEIVQSASTSRVSLSKKLMPEYILSSHISLYSLIGKLMFRVFRFSPI